MNSIAAYLALPPAYTAALGGLRWSSSDDAIVYADNLTFALNAEIGLFLEGFNNARSLIHFPHLLHLVDLLRPFPEGKRSQTPGTRLLYLAYREAGGSISNAGAFFGTILKDLPAYPGVTDLREITRILREPIVPAHWFVSFFQQESGYEPEMPPLSPEEFERRVLQSVQAYSMDDLIAWFRYGRGPIKEEAGDLVEQLTPEPPPRTLAGVLAHLLERPRLAPVQPLLAGLVSALSLPPRRRQEEHLPIGGYCDVTTHGQPAQILPSQLALDPMEFLRRFAERELLYFQREEPQRQTQEELVILLDQGVRTWGDVRLVLSAAALALLKRVSSRRTPLRLAATSNPGVLVDPLEATDEEVGELLETSDLTPHPAEALTATLAQPAELPRDLILLTHPRNLRQAEVAAAARAVPSDTRFFALTLDPNGDANLWQCRNGMPVKVRHFRVDLSQIEQEAEEKPAAAPAPRANWTRWRGDVEPVPFPFTFGISGSIVARGFDFDYEGKWLLIANAKGLLHCWNVETKDLEILPRCQMTNDDSVLLTNVDEVLGVAGGFVVRGHVAQDAFLAHYDFNTRTCRGYRLEGHHDGEWCYLRGFHSLAQRKGGVVITLDLTTGERHKPDASAMKPSSLRPAVDWDLNFEEIEAMKRRERQAPRSPRSRAAAAWEYCTSVSWPARWLTMTQHYYGTSPEAGPPANCLHLDLEGERFRVVTSGKAIRAWQELPRVNGLPLLANHRLDKAQIRSGILALKAGRATGAPGKAVDWQLFLMHEPDGKLLGQLPSLKANGGFILSNDGERIAWQSNRREVQVNFLTPVEELSQVRFTTLVGCFHQSLDLVIGDQWLGISVTGADYAHLLWWQDGMLQHECGTSGLSALSTGHPGRQARSNPRLVPDWLGYDQQRFTTAATATLTAVGDTRGQVAVFGGDRQLICMFFVFRLNIQAWMPDGTRLNRNDLSAEPRHLPPAAREARARLAAALETAAHKGAPL